MPAPTVPFKMLAQGYEVSGNNTEGFRATVPFLVAWSDAFNFADQVMGKAGPPTTVGGLISYRLPWVFPAATARLYASDFTVRPIGQNGQPLPPYFGMKPGEFFTHAVVTVNFATPPYTQNVLDDPAGNNQLDPANPITLCEQSVKMGGKMRSRKGSGYVYTDNKALTGEVAVPEKEARLVLKFPKVPYLPWQRIQPFIGSLNSDTVFNCPKGTLIFEGGDTQYSILSDGTQGQMLNLEFTYQEHDWNMEPRADTGEFDYVYKKGHAGDEAYRIFPYKDVRDLFVGYSVEG